MNSNADNRLKGNRQDPPQNKTFILKKTKLTSFINLDQSSFARIIHNKYTLDHFLST